MPQLIPRNEKINRLFETWKCLRRWRLFKFLLVDTGASVPGVSGGVTSSDDIIFYFDTFTILWC